MRLACGAFLAVLGGVTWSEYLFLWDAGIDDLLMPTAAGSGKMSGASAVCSLMSGLALLLLDRRIGSFFWPAQWLALGVAELAVGHYLPALGGTVGFSLIGALCLWRAYRSTIRLYTGEATKGPAASRETMTSTSAGPPHSSAAFRLLSRSSSFSTFQACRPKALADAAISAE